MDTEYDFWELDEADASGYANSISTYHESQSTDNPEFLQGKIERLQPGEALLIMRQLDT